MRRVTALLCKGSGYKVARCADVPHLVSGLHPLRDLENTELLPGSADQACALSAGDPSLLSSGTQAILSEWRGYFGA